MKVSLNWLADYITLNVDPVELANILTRTGLEVEEILSTATVPEGVVTAKILSREKHPNSDHLSVCQVDPGNGEVLQIVCGAPNCDAGNIVPLATTGTVFKDPEGGKNFKIGKGKLRGIESFGMMCSARELGLSNDHDGLLILPPETKLGLSVAELFKDNERMKFMNSDGFIYIKSEYKLIRIDYDDILYVEGVKDYIKLYFTAGKKPVMSLMSMKKMEDYLPKPQFLRVHRSFIVNMAKVEMIDRGRIVIGESFIPISESYKEIVQDYIDNHTLQ